MPPSRATTPPAASGPALTLFVVGTMIGLLSLLGRLGQEFSARLLTSFSNVWHIANRSTPRPAPLPPLLRDLDRSGALLILAGFAVSTLCLLLSAGLWHSADHPPTRRTRAWTRVMHWITAALATTMFSAAVVGNPGLRLALMIVPGLTALLLFVAFVYLLVEVQFLNSAPPDDDSPYTPS